MKKFITYGLVALSLAVASCDKFLDVKPQTQVPTKDFYQKENGFEDALTGCYMKMTDNSLYGRFLTLESIDFLAQYYPNAQGSSVQAALMNFDYRNKSVEANIKRAYNAFYNIILQANDVLEHISAPEAENIVKSPLKRNIIKGEALALRGFLHFDLLRLFGQLPQHPGITVSLPYSEVTGVENRPVYGYDEFLAKVLKDLTEAEQLLADDPAVRHHLNKHVHEDIDDDFYYYRKFRFNLFAVKAALARVYLYAGDRSNAYAKAKEVLDTPGEQGSYFNLAGENDFNEGHFALPSEIIFGLSSSKLEGSEYEGLFKDIQGSSNFAMYFSKDRRDQLFQGRNTASNNRYNRMWGELRSLQGNMVPYYRKYMQNEDDSSTDIKLENRWIYPIFRVSELYLILMETSSDLGEINRLFYAYMVARNEQPAEFKKMEDAQKEVINEYRREFMAEGQMFFTYKRLEAKQMKWRRTPVSEENYIIPIPTSEINK